MWKISPPSNVIFSAWGFQLFKRFITPCISHSRQCCGGVFTDIATIILPLSCRPHLSFTRPVVYSNRSATHGWPHVGNCCNPCRQRVSFPRQHALHTSDSFNRTHEITATGLTKSSGTVGGNVGIIASLPCSTPLVRRCRNDIIYIPFICSSLTILFPTTRRFL